MVIPRIPVMVPHSGIPNFPTYRYTGYKVQQFTVNGRNYHVILFILHLPLAVFQVSR